MRPAGFPAPPVGWGTRDTRNTAANAVQRASAPISVAFRTPRRRIRAVSASVAGRRRAVSGPLQGRQDGRQSGE